MPPSDGPLNLSTIAGETGTGNMENSGFLELIEHQQLLLYIVCGLGGLMVLLLAVCIVCSCKEKSRRQQQEQLRRQQRRARETTVGRGRTGDELSVAAEPVRRRSRDMRNSGAHGNTTMMTAIGQPGRGMLTIAS
ncbi:hypothetical protein DPMN_046759 [Dreissena polymorpha]|uniref:Uncharacterized protein n=1 Tax=Dreissena polymorpha TaxID=45954 RepID=A0A9D4I0U8_DREPO|nr:hypothetical protein DPMN_046759 [Dreissena polymorpha]